MRPPLIRTDIADLLSRPGSLLPALGDPDFRLLPLLAVDVDAPSLALCHRRFGEVRPVSAGRRLLDHLELLRDARRPVERLRIHDPDAELVRPDQRVDLVHLPGLMAARQRGAVLQDDADAVSPVVTAIDPAAE